MHVCFNCQHPWESSLRQPAVKEICERCGAYLHCCKNCRFHRKGYPNECYVPDTEKVADKARANFCDEFEFRTAGADSVSPLESRDALDRLWGSESDTDSASGECQESVKEWLSEADKPKKDFEDLFED